jgi:hypothetical protein
MRLRTVLDGEPPPGVAALPEQAQRELAELIAAARTAQNDALDAAFEGVLRHVPFPVRGIARRMLRG